ncbi:MAG: hypothetical protein SGI90_06955 [Candidatus Eisenbacteria bacterium]|nr:hypothetical protein [Candidatus Eisenbacteria bacterium]
MTLLAHPSPVRGIGLPDLLGASPADSSAVPPTGSEYLDSLNVGPGADLAFIRFEDQVARLALGDQARTGVEGIARPTSLGSPGWGRLTASLDGFPMGQGVVHWDNAAWFPIRGISRFGLAGGAAAIRNGEGAGRVVLAETFPGQTRPASVVSLLGGSFGHRLAELDFARQFGAVAFHADVADFGHDGFGVIGRTDASRGFARLDFSVLGFEARFGLGLAAGSMEAGGAALDSGTESTDESSITFRLTRPMRSGRLEISVLSESSRLAIESLTTDSFRLTRGRWWGEATRIWSSQKLEGRVAVFASRETRTGVLPDDGRFDGGGLLVAGQWHGSPAWQFETALRLRLAEPAGIEFEPGITLAHAIGSRGRCWLEASRSSGFPGLLLHLDQPLANLERAQEVLLRIEELQTPERHLRLAIGGETGDALRAGGELSVVHTDNRQPWLSLAPGAPLGPDREGSWSGDARLSCRWRARQDLEFGVAAGVASFDGALEPYRPRGRADGWTRLSRSYFGRDLDLSVELAGHLLGPRTNPAGETYPTLLAVDGTLTARIRTLTLFLRLENMAGLFMESDLRDPDFPLPLPGLSSKLGATLRLAD